MYTEKPTFDLVKARRETRACENLIHFNNAGASLMPAPVADCLHDYLYQEEACGGYETRHNEQVALDHFYTTAARLINCHPDEIAFMENATRAWDSAFYGFQFSPGDKVLTSYSEYGSNVIAYLHQAKNLGIELVFVPNDRHGQIDTDALETMIDDRVKLISLNHIPTAGGLVNPVKEVGQIARKHTIPFLLDACQSLGQIPIDVEDIGCDILSGTGRKFLRGPRATGLLYVRRSLLAKLEPPLIDQHAATLVSPTHYELRSDARRFENWEQNFAGKAALGVAIDYALSFGLEAIQTRVYALAAELRHQLANIDGIEITDEGIEKCAIVTFKTRQKEPAQIKQNLGEVGINVSAATGSGSLVSFQQRGLESVVRASLHYYNTNDEIDRFIKILKELLNE